MMPGNKISELTELTSPESGDFFVIVDTSAGQTKKLNYSNITTTANDASLIIASQVFS